MAATKAVLPVTTAEPEATEVGYEHLDAGGDQAVTDAPADGNGIDDGDRTAGAAASDDTKAAQGWTRLACILAYGILPAAALLLVAAAGYVKWVDGTARDAEVASAQSVQAAIDSTVAMLSYRPDTVEQNLSAARDRMTGAFRDSYTSLTHDVVIPGAKQRQISAVATVPAAASVSATSTHAVVLLFVNQTTVVGNDPPTSTASSVKVTLDKERDRWLISQFDPV
jgi:Mce-associated membrane protein